ncbi:MAG: SpoIIE family protein phosphatase [Polyangiaceae bacterium]
MRQHAQLEAGEFLLLYTDGVIEAAHAVGEPYGSERPCAELEAAQHDSVSAIRDRLLASLCGLLTVQEDDIAPFVARHRRPNA